MLENDDTLDPWALLGLPGALPLANYLTARQSAAQYRLIVDVLLDQQAHSLTGIAHDDLAELVHTRLSAVSNYADARLEEMNLNSRMAQLTEWGVVDSWDERPERDEDFLRNSNRYQLTALGRV